MTQGVGVEIAQTRRAAGLTQRELAARSGVAQSHIARIEKGRVEPTPVTVERLLTAARPDASAVLAAQRDRVIEASQRRRGTGAVWVFGSVARGEATPDSDIDLLVEFAPGADLFDVAGLEMDLTELLGRKVDVMPSSSQGRAADHARRDAVAL